MKTNVHRINNKYFLEIRLFLSLIVFFALFSFGNRNATAQFAIPNTEEAYFELSSQTPTPLEEYTITIIDYSLDLSRSEVWWFVDGERQIEFDDKTSITQVGTALGDSTSVRAIIDPNTLSSKTVESVVVSGDVDIVLESDVYTPHFYKGRKRPSFGSEVTLAALPYLYNESGRRLASNELLFRWYVDDTLVGEGRNMETITFDPPRFGFEFIRLDIESLGGEIRYSELLSPTLADPQIIFYEQNPIRGLSPNSLPGVHRLETEEVTLRAEPYFFSPDIFDNSIHQWSINGQPIENINGDDFTLITFGNQGGDGFSDVGFGIQHLEQLGQQATALVTLLYGDIFEENTSTDI